MPRSRSSGALSIWSYARNFAKFFFASTAVIAAVSVVLPWSTCPIVPMFRCGLPRAYNCLAMICPQALVTERENRSGPREGPPRHPPPRVLEGRGGGGSASQAVGGQTGG